MVTHHTKETIWRWSEITEKFESKIYLSFKDFKNWNKGKSCWNKSFFTFQQRDLSSRTLFFGKQDESF